MYLRCCQFGGPARGIRDGLVPPAAHGRRLCAFACRGRATPSGPPATSRGAWWPKRARPRDQGLRSRPPRARPSGRAGRRCRRERVQQETGGEPGPGVAGQVARPGRQQVAHQLRRGQIALPHCEERRVLAPRRVREPLVALRHADWRLHVHAQPCRQPAAARSRPLGEKVPVCRARTQLAGSKLLRHQPGPGPAIRPGFPARGIHGHRIGQSRYARSILMNGANRAVQKERTHTDRRLLVVSCRAGLITQCDKERDPVPATVGRPAEAGSQPAERGPASTSSPSPVAVSPCLGHHGPRRPVGLGNTIRGNLRAVRLRCSTRGQARRGPAYGGSGGRRG